MREGALIHSFLCATVRKDGKVQISPADFYR